MKNSMEFDKKKIDTNVELKETLKPGMGFATLT